MKKFYLINQLEIDWKIVYQIGQTLGDGST